MKLPVFLKLFVVAFVISLVGYYVERALGMTSGALHPSVFATGLFLGVVLGGLLLSLLGGSKAGSSNGTKTIYVGNLPFSAGKDEVMTLFAPYGQVVDVRLVRDRRTRRSKGYCFVEMQAADAERAIQSLNGTDYAGRTLRLNEAKDKEENE